MLWLIIFGQPNAVGHVVHSIGQPGQNAVTLLHWSMRTFSLLLMLTFSFSFTAVAKERRHKSRRAKITLDVQDAEVQNVLRLISEVARLNLVIDEGVKGKISLKLRDVYWRSALDVVLDSKGLGIKKHGENLYRIAPKKVLAEERVARGELRKLSLEKSPLITKSYRVNYAKASDMAARLKTLLSPRGRVTFDERTNIVIITDVEDSLAFSRP